MEKKVNITLGQLLSITLIVISIALGAWINVSRNNKPEWNIKQKVEFYSEANGKYNYTIGYKVETRLIIKEKRYSYDLIFGDFVKSESETYGKLSEQLCTADSMIIVALEKY